MSAVTFSGANGIDFNVILNAVMAQERLPLDTLEAQKSTLTTQSNAFSSLATKLGAVGTASEALTKAAAFGGRSVSTTDSSIVTASGSTDAVPGLYDIVVRELARAQVTSSASTVADVDATIVATGGSITIGGQTVVIDQAVTLEGLASAINGTNGIGVTATIVNSTGGYRLVLTGTETGVAHAFTITSQLAGSRVTFADTDADGISGDSAADNSMSATDANVLINNVEVSSTTNTIDNAIPGTSLTLLRKQPTTTVTVSVTETSDATREQVDAFVAAYNTLMTFAQQQTASSTGIGRDPLFRSMHGDLRNTLLASYSSGGTLETLGQAGIEFDRTGRLQVNETLFAQAMADNPDGLRALFMGDGTNEGAFQALTNTIKRYTGTGALLSSIRDRLSDQIANMTERLAAMEDRLAVRRAALQQEYIAADTLISQLNNQAGSLSSLGSGYSLF